MGSEHSVPYKTIKLPKLYGGSLKEISQSDNNYGTFAKWLLARKHKYWSDTHELAFGRDNKEYTYILINTPITLVKKSVKNSGKTVYATYETPIGFRWRKNKYNEEQDTYQIVFRKQCISTDSNDLCREHKCKLEECPDGDYYIHGVRYMFGRGGDDTVTTLPWTGLEFHKTVNEMMVIIDKQIEMKFIDMGEYRIVPVGN